MKLERFAGADSWAVDGLLVLLAVTFLLFGSRQAAVGHVPPRRPLEAIVYVVLAFAGVALVSRRRAPASLFALEVLLGAVYLARGYPYGPLLVVVGLAAYGLGRRRGTTATMVATGPAALALVLAYVIGYAPRGLVGAADAVAQAGWVLVPALVGGLVREARAASSRADEEAAARRTEQERLRVAREIHDDDQTRRPRPRPTCGARASSRSGYAAAMTHLRPATYSEAAR